MADEFLGARKQALENSFFAKRNEELLGAMREKREKSAAVAALKETSGLEDDALLGKLVDLGIDAATWAALSLVPLVEVAWADGEMQDKERSAILAAAAEQGIGAGSPSHDLLQGWLERRPEAALFATWSAYAEEVVAGLSPPERSALRSQIVERALKIAETAGGFLGIGSVSEDEKRVIVELRRPFA